MGMNRSSLRETARVRSAGRCDWPGHRGHAGDELAHFHSIGSGGNPDGSRDLPNNWGFLCRDSARVSDGEHGSGGAVQYRLFMIQLLGARVFDGMTVDRRGWERAEALRRHIEEMYGSAVA